MEKPTIEIDLSGPDGNAFVVMGAACKALYHAGRPKKYITTYKEKAMAGDYAHLLEVTKEYVNLE